MYNRKRSTTVFRNYQAHSIPEAIFRGLFKQIRKLIQTGSDPNETFPVRFVYSITAGKLCEVSESLSALAMCAFIDDAVWSRSLVSQLLQNGARTQLTNDDSSNLPNEAIRFSVLHLMVIRSQADLLPLLLDALDCDLHASSGIAGRPSLILGFTALHFAVRSSSQLSTLQILIDYCQKHGYTIDPVNHMGHTPLLEAIRHFNFSAADILIKFGANCDFQFGRESKFRHYYQLIRNQTLTTPTYLHSKLRRSLSINSDPRLIELDKLIKCITDYVIEEAPNFDIRNDPKWVNACSTLNSGIVDALGYSVKNSNLSHEKTGWMQTLPNAFDSLVLQHCSNYRKGVNVEQMLNEFNAVENQAAEGDGGGHHRRNAANRSGKLGGSSRRNESGNVVGLGSKYGSGKPSNRKVLNSAGSMAIKKK